eukprot:m.52905 g.52905  ORF g.52905 m.52905 type:complete len:136 (+) comp13111_c0_seq2:85-492(+)
MPAGNDSHWFSRLERIVGCASAFTMSITCVGLAISAILVSLKMDGRDVVTWWGAGAPLIAALFAVLYMYLVIYVRVKLRSFSHSVVAPVVVFGSLLASTMMLCSHLQRDAVTAPQAAAPFFVAAAVVWLRAMIVQ